MKKFLIHKFSILAVIFPVFCLIGMAGINEYYLRTGQALVLPVEGYDPRDILSGHYLVYKVNYGLNCPDDLKSHPVTAYMCFKPRKYIAVQKPESCLLFIKGRCKFANKEFQANIDRYYIPEKKAKQLEQKFLEAGEKEVVLSVTKKGNAFVKDILIDGTSIKNLIR